MNFFCEGGGGRDTYNFVQFLCSCLREYAYTPVFVSLVIGIR